MTYRIIGVDDRHVVIEFRKNGEEMYFDSYQEAEQYMEKIKKEAVLPSKYKLTIEVNTQQPSKELTS